MRNNGTLKNICIIGCAGFIGSHFVERLLSRPDYRIFGIDIDERKISHLINHDRFEYQHFDIRKSNDNSVLSSVIENSDCVFSLAALCNPSLYNTKPLSVVDVNFTHSLEVVRQCVAHKKWLIHFSTCEVYGMSLARFLSNGSGGENPEHYLFKEDETPLILGPIHAQRWIYASAKELLERIIYAYNFENGLDFTIIRPFNFVGPRMDYIPGVDGEGIPRVLACFISNLLYDQPLRLVDGGTATRTVTYIDDAIDAMEQVLNMPDASKGQIFNIGNPNNEVTIRELAKKMIAVYQTIHPAEPGSPYVTEEVTGQEFYGDGYMDSDRRTGDFTKARNILNWQPKTDLDTTLQKTITYFVQEYRQKIDPTPLR